ncbi:tyrosine-type recombinase/integrase [Castellaniella sp. UC4442_H9]
MAKKIPPLTDSQCRRARHNADGGNRLFDGGGLYLETLPTGQKRWRLKYRRPVSRKENIHTLGAYPEIGLVAARALREEAKRQLASGIDPGHAPARSPDTSTKRVFSVVAEEWLDIKRESWSAGYHSRIKNALTANAYPYFGNAPMDLISGKMVLDAVKAVEKRGALEMASRVLEAVGMVFGYAVGVGEVHASVTQDLPQFLAERPPVQHFPHVREDSIPLLMQRINSYHGRPETRYAMQLMARTFLRTKELIWARWSEFNLEAAIWEIPAARMKGTKIRKEWGESHLVPLSRQTIALLKELRHFSGRHEFLFPGVRNPRGPISSETINKALKIMGFEGEQTGHGFRGLASTIMNERSGIRPDVIECQLAHKEKNKVREAYNHAKYWDERCALMQWWSDYLDECASHTPIEKIHTPIHTPKRPLKGLAPLGNPCK